MAIAVFIKSRTQPDKRAAVRSVFEQHLAPRARQNPDQLVVAFCEDSADQDVFHLFEVYSSPEAMQANGSSQAFLDYMAAVGPLLDGSPVWATAAPVWVAGIPLTRGEDVTAS